MILPIEHLVYPHTALRDTDNDELYDDLEVCLDEQEGVVLNLIIRRAKVITGEQIEDVRRSLRTALTDAFVQGACAGKREAIGRYERLGLIRRLLWALRLEWMSKH
jgi:hypothetical protein